MTRRRPSYNIMVTAEEALRVECPKCGAKPGTACDIPTSRTATTHRDRMQAARRARRPI